MSDLIFKIIIFHCVPHGPQIYTIGFPELTSLWPFNFFLHFLPLLGECPLSGGIVPISSLLYILYHANAHAHTIWHQKSMLMLQQDRAHRDENFELSYVKFCLEIKKLRVITYFIYLAVSDILQLRCPNPLILAKKYFFAQIFFLLLWKEGKCPKLHKFVQGHFWRFECFNQFIYNLAYVYIMILQLC